MMQVRNDKAHARMQPYPWLEHPRMHHHRHRFVTAVALLTTALAVAGSVSTGVAGETPQTRADAYREAAALTELGRKLFSDPILSGSGKLACASCHVPGNGFTPTNARAVQLGGRDLKHAGTRAVPALTYLQATPPFTEHFFDSEEEGD